MKTASILVCWLLCNTVVGQGKFASAFWKPMIGKSCKSETDFFQLKGFALKEGTLLSDVDDDERKSVAVFTKGSTVVILFEVMTNNSINVIDIVEITNVLKTQEVRAGTCRDGENDMIGLIALVGQSKENRWRAVKAWNYNLDKMRVESWPAGAVSCLGIEGDD